MSAGRIIARATVVILALTLLSRFLGLGREMAIAYRFGATGTTDAFLVAFLIPYTFYGVVGMALATVIVPLFAEYATQGRREEAWRVMSLVVNAVLVVLGGLALLGVAGAPLIAWVLVFAAASWLLRLDELRYMVEGGACSQGRRCQPVSGSSTPKCLASRR